ncbi:MAG: hypothetical protein F4058_05875 [Rhodothermaceae bacterium]|nr:hypothetical protein [Rhodothermaceae bacterium]
MRNFWMNLLAVVVGYLVMAIGIGVVFSAAYMVMGAEGAYQPDSWDVSSAWVIMSIIVGVCVALVAGKVCYLIARNHTATKYLIALVLVLGVVSAITMMVGGGGGDEVRDFAPSVLEATEKSVQPVWLSWLNPLIGAAGVAVGSGMVKVFRDR